MTKVQETYLPIDSVYPELLKRIRRITRVMRINGFSIQVVDSYRSFQKQNELYNKGRVCPGAIVTNSQAGESFHNYGLAVDVVFLDKDGRPSWAEKHPWSFLGMTGKFQGLEWGGDWKKI